MNIVLCGFMGSGKTVVGKELAKIMGRRFVDTDQLVEARSGVSIPAIFRCTGKTIFESWSVQPAQRRQRFPTA